MQLIIFIFIMLGSRNIWWIINFVYIYLIWSCENSEMYCDIEIYMNFQLSTVPSKIYNARVYRIIIAMYIIHWHCICITDGSYIFTITWNVTWVIILLKNEFHGYVQFREVDKVTEKMFLNKSVWTILYM